MKKSLSDILRKMASMIVVDTTPTEEEIQRERQRVRCREETPPEGLGVPVPKPQVQEDAMEEKYLPQPEIRRPRREREHQKKWNKETKTELMKDYMQQYRADGNDVGNRYVKKPKV
jgi:hypothetical protein